MTIRITKLRFGALMLAFALLAPSAAWATHVFVDVADGAFYAAPAEWAKTNNITTGSPAGSNTFKPLNDVTRGEAVTFLKRYNDNVAVPEIGNTLFASDTNLTSAFTLGDLGLSANVKIPAGHTGVIEITYSAESACYGGNGWCQVSLLVNGSATDAATFAFDSTNGGTETSTSWEGHSMTRVTGGLAAGTYVITAESSIGGGTATFRLDDMALTAEVHLTS